MMQFVDTAPLDTVARTRERGGEALSYIDPVEALPANYKLLVENDRGRLLEMTVKAGEKDEVHSHPSEMVYFISGGKARVHLPDGESMEAEFPDGGVMDHEEWTHQVENIGDTDIHAIIFELKS